MRSAPVEERTGPALFWVGSAWALFVLATFTLGSFRALPYWGTLFRTGPAFPGAPGLVPAWAGFMGILLTVLAVLAVVWVLGRRLRTWLGLEVLETWVRVSLDFFLGTILLGLFWVGTGLNGLWAPLPWGFLGLPLLAWCLLDLWRNHWKAGTWTLRVFFPREAGLACLFLVGLWYCSFALLQALTPETFYDSMVYHLAVPARWLLDHGIVDLPWNFFSNFPYAAEIFFLNGFLLQGTESAKALHVVSFIVCAVLAGGWAREISGPRAGWLALGMVLTFPLLALCVWTTQVEGYLALACLAFLYALDRWIREGGRGWALLTGLFAGTALAVKYTAFPLAASALLVMALQRSGPVRERTSREGAWVLGGWVLALGPWVLKNSVFTGNPFFPYFMDLFPGRRIPPESYLKLLEEQRVLLAQDLWGCLKLPWTLTMANPDAYIFIGPMALGLFPLLFLFRFRNPSLRFLGTILPVLFLAGLSITHILKFSLPAFLVLYLVLGAVLGACRFPLLVQGAAWAAAAAGLACFSYLASIHHGHYDNAGYWLGKAGRDQYLQGEKRVAPYQDAARWIAGNLPREDRLLVVGGSRGLHLERPFVNQSVFDEQVLRRIVKRAKDPEGIHRGLRQEGLEVLLVLVPEGLHVSNYGHYDLTSEEWARLEGFLHRGTQLLYLKDLQGIYRLKKELEPRAGTPFPDLLLWLSRPAAGFIGAARRGDRVTAERELAKVLDLYPFSQEWKDQAKVYREAKN